MKRLVKKWRVSVKPFISDQRIIGIDIGGHSRHTSSNAKKSEENVRHLSNKMAHLQMARNFWSELVVEDLNKVVIEYMRPPVRLR